MKKKRTKHLDFILLDIIAMELALFIAFFVLHKLYHTPLTFNREFSLFLAAANISITFFTEGHRDVLRRGYMKEVTAVLRHLMLVTMVTILFLFFLDSDRFYFRQLLIIMMPASLPLIYIGRVLLKLYLKKRYLSMKHATNVMVIGSGVQAEMIIASLLAPSVSVFRIVDLAVLDRDMRGEQLYGITVTTNQEDLVKNICTHVIDEVFISYPEDIARELEIVELLVSVGIVTHLFAERQSNAFRHCEFETLAGMGVMTCSNSLASSFGIFVKRSLDIVGGLVGLMLAFIIGLFIAPAIYIKSPGPILFSQQRVGRNGRPFKLYKFRSMYMDAEKRKAELMSQNSMQGYMFKLENDPRIINGIGQFIRRTSLDEFPQFYNVLMGEMSLVGTRPPTVDEFENYELHHKKRLSMRPGITGLWQVSGRNQITDFEDVVRLDAEYIDNWSLELDFKILFKTVWVVLHHTGAQ